jgi:hypothetical protein
VKTALFLDIDGVLHPLGASEFEEVGRELIVTGQDLLRWVPILWELIGEVDVQLVVHSSWRHIYRLDEIVRRFPMPIRDRIFDVTAGAGRYESIVQYVERYRIDRFAVLDDLPSAFPTRWPHLIACDPELGINDPLVQDRVRHFLRYADGRHQALPE